MMNLLDVLNKFPKDIVEKVDRIEYCNGPDDFEITAWFEYDDEVLGADIVLFEDGETMLNVNGADGNIHVFEEVIDFYCKVREIWKGVVKEDGEEC